MPVFLLIIGVISVVGAFDALMEKSLPATAGWLACSLACFSISSLLTRIDYVRLAAERTAAAAELSARIAERQAQASVSVLDRS